MSIKVGDRIVMAPSGVQKERMVPEDMFVLAADGQILETPCARPPPYKPPKLSECSPLFMAVWHPSLAERACAPASAYLSSAGCLMLHVYHLPARNDRPTSSEAPVRSYTATR